MADYSNSLPPSLAQDVFTGNASLNGLDISKGTSLAEVFNNPTFDVDTTGAEFTGSPLATSPAWTFICAPESISWSTSNAVNRVDMFGTNGPPAVSGTRGMRELRPRFPRWRICWLTKIHSQAASSTSQFTRYGPIRKVTVTAGTSC